MSNSPVIPKEKLSAYQRWELHAFDAPSESPAAPEKKAAAEAEKVRHIHQHAYNAGRADGLKEGAAKTALEVQRMQAVVAALERHGAEVGQTVAQEVLELALEVARQMMRQALIVRPEFIFPLIQDALERAGQAHAGATLALNPADVAIVREHLGSELTAAGWRLVEDAAIQAGGAMVQTSATQIDATLDTRWKRLASALGTTSDWLVPDDRCLIRNLIACKIPRLIFRTFCATAAS